MSRVRDYHSENKVLPLSTRTREVYNEYKTKLNMRDTSDSGTISSSPSRSLSDFKGGNHLKKERDLSYNGIKIVTIDFLPTKKKTPMHFKLYESTLQEVRERQ